MLFYRQALTVNEPQVMQLKVSQLLKEPVGSTRRYLVDENLSILEGALPSRVFGEVKLLRTDRGVLARGNLKTSVELVCSRCLEPFSDKLVYDFEEEFFPVLDIVHDAYIPEPEDSEGFTIDEYHVLDISEAARQYAILAVPMKPLCRPNCKGISI